MKERKRHGTMLLSFWLCGTLLAGAQEMTKTHAGFRTTLQGTDIQVECYTPSTVRITKSPAGTSYRKESYSVIAHPEAVPFTLQQGAGTATLRTKSLTVKLDTKAGTFAFYANDGTLLFREKEAATFAPMDDAGTPAFRVKQAFVLEEDEPLYGLGNLENGRLSQRGEDRTLMPGNVEDGIPFFLSAKGYGVFWDNYSPTRFADNKEEGTLFESETGDCADYYFLYGGNADGVVAQVRRLTGEVPMFPLWTYGFWQSRERYKSQEELLEVVRRYRKEGIPLDGIIQDWQYWGNNYLWNAMEFMNGEFPRPQEMIDEIHERNAHCILSIWSSFGPMTKPYRELDAKGMLFRFGTWPQSGISEQWPPRMDYPSGVRVYDAYHPEAREIYWKHLTRLFDLHVDGWWMDSTEPDHLDFRPEDLDTPTYLGSFRKVRGAYPLMTVGGVYDHQRAATAEKRVFILTRSGFMGQQRYGCNVWTGDVTSTWESLRKQVPAMLNFSLTGNPNVNSDLGGFFAGAYNKHWNDGTGVLNPAYRELYVRWMQMGAFTPMMRSHGTEVPRELYYYGKAGEPVYDALTDAVRLRYRLLPYIYSTSWEVSRRQGTFMRALVMDFADDRNAWERADEYMFGRSLLVAPVLHAQYTPEVTKQSRTDEEGWNQNSGMKEVLALKEADFTQPRTMDIYLPAGTCWYDWTTGERFEGGQEITRKTTIASIPVFVRAGSILPVGPDVQYAAEKDWSELEIRVYPGADGSFLLYEDEGDSYRYEEGAYTEIPFTWDEASRRLTIGARKGSYEGMLSARCFTIVLPDGTQRRADYTGKRTAVRF